jgi:hypothetical protein
MVNEPCDTPPYRLAFLWGSIVSVALAHKLIREGLLIGCLIQGVPLLTCNFSLFCENENCIFVIFRMNMLWHRAAFNWFAILELGLGSVVLAGNVVTCWSTRLRVKTVTSFASVFHKLWEEQLLDAWCRIGEGLRPQGTTANREALLEWRVTA